MACERPVNWQKRLARETGGLIWDDETREIFSPDEWHARRVETWKSEVPELARHTTIHAYKNETLVRAITLGITKFGLPDIVIEDLPGMIPGTWES